MDISPFVQFTLNSRYIKRWLIGGIMLYLPILNFFSIGYLSKSSRLIIIGDIGLPTWEDKHDIWTEGVKLTFVFILYEAIPFFLFSSGFFFTTLSSITAFFGNIIMKISYVAFLVFSFFLPFAFATFAEHKDLRKALAYEKILAGIKEVLVPYAVGYVATLLALYVALLFIRIPFLLGFLITSLMTNYIFLISTYYFSRIYKRTSLALDRMPEDFEGKT